MGAEEKVLKADTEALVTQMEEEEEEVKDAEAEEEEVIEAEAEEEELKEAVVKEDEAIVAEEEVEDCDKASTCSSAQRKSQKSCDKHCFRLVWISFPSYRNY